MPGRPGPPELGEASKKFLASMNVTYSMWHDGEGYDLDSLRDVPAGERPAIERILIEHDPRDWRDIEALAHLDSPDARAVVESALEDPDPEIRQEAMKHAADKVDPAKRERLLIDALERTSLFGGLGEAIDEAAEFHPPGVVDALLRGALDRDGEASVHFAALLMYIHGKAAEPFDWDQRPFFLRFDEPDPAKRAIVFRELCTAIGVDAERYLAAGLR